MGQALAGRHLRRSPALSWLERQSPRSVYPLKKSSEAKEAALERAREIFHATCGPASSLYLRFAKCLQQLALHCFLSLFPSVSLSLFHCSANNAPRLESLCCLALIVCVCISFHFICTDQSRRYFYVPCDNYQTIKTINCDDTIKEQSKVARPLVTRLQSAPHPPHPKEEAAKVRPSFISARCVCLFLLILTKGGRMRGEMGGT